METLGRIRARGDSDFTVGDIDSMPYLLAVGKVCLEPAYLLTRADPPTRTGNLEILPDFNRYLTCGHGRQCPSPYETHRGRFWKGLQRVTRSRRDTHIHLHIRTPLVRSSSRSTSPWGSLGLRLVSSFHRNKDLWGSDAHEFRPERWFDANEKPESPFGVYSNLCVMCFCIRRLYDELRSFDIVLPSPEVPGVALDGGLRKSPDSAFGIEQKRTKS